MPSESSGSYSIPNFPIQGKSHRESWPIWLDLILEIAELQNAPVMYGLLGFLLSSVDWLNLPGNTVSFAPRESAGVFPRQILTNWLPIWLINWLPIWLTNWLPNSESSSTAAAAISQFSYVNSAYANEIFSHNIFKIKFVKSLDEESLAVVADPDGSTRAVKLDIMLARLANAYGEVTVNELTNNSLKLLIAFLPPSNLRQHILIHSKAHAFALKQSQPFSEAEKVRLLTQSLSQCGIFTLALLIYSTSNPTVASQTFASLS